MTLEVLALLEAFNDAFNRHDVPAMMALTTGNCIFENTFPPPDGTRYIGQAAVSRFWDEFFQSSPVAKIEIEEIFAGEDRAVQRWLYKWSDAEPGTGYIRGIDLFRFQDGKIAEKLSYVKG
jgi:predicted SnoaL-like aldol condensation-catalyzing enzyme